MRRWQRRVTGAVLAMVSGCAGPAVPSTSPLAGTGQRACYDEVSEIDCAATGAFSGQDAQNGAPTLAYRDEGDGTVTDLVTGLRWTRDALPERTFDEAMADAATLRVGGFADWRLPTVNELFSLMDFRGNFGPSAGTSRPFIDTSVFGFSYADDGVAVGARFIDVQVWSSSQYVRTTGPGGDATVFGVNFADGRVKGYPKTEPGSVGARPQRMRVRYVRGAPVASRTLVATGEGTVVDSATGLEWHQADDGVGRTWAEALAFCRDSRLAGHDDWRLADVKQLYSLVDVTRVPAIDPVFTLTRPEAYAWSSTTLLDGPPELAPSKAAYVAFGPALGWFEVPPGSGQWRLVDIHGAGAQRADPKRGDPAAFPRGFGPQGDDVRITNQVRCVRRVSPR
jgi:hypothetical protein